MLPFLKKPDSAKVGLMVKTRPSDYPKAEETSLHSDAIQACAQDLIDAIHAKDAKRASQALVDAFDILESLPHDEVEHED